MSTCVETVVHRLKVATIILTVGILQLHSASHGYTQLRNNDDGQLIAAHSVSIIYLAKSDLIFHSIQTDLSTWRQKYLHGLSDRSMEIRKVLARWLLSIDGSINEPIWRACV